MEDKTCRKLVGTIKYVLININNFSFPADFMVLDVKTTKKIPFILEQPFMKIARMLVGIDKGQVKVRSKDCEVCLR